MSDAPEGFGLDTLLAEIDAWCTDAGVGGDVSLLAVELG